MFEQAARLKLRFSHKGPQTVEDLWDLPVEVLDSLYSGLRAEQKASDEESLLKTVSSSSTRLTLKLDIIKHIVSVKLAEQDAKKQKILDRERKSRIQEIISKRKDEQLSNLPLEDLEKMAAEL